MNLNTLIILSIGLSTGTLGKQKRIIGGVQTDIKDFPSMVSIRNYTGKKHYCGGVIISRRHVLTAAHCVYNKEFDNMRVYTGTTYSINNLGQENEVQTVDIYPDFTCNRSPCKGSEHDLAIVTLKENIEFTRLQRPAILEPSDVKAGDLAEIIGWGQAIYPGTTFSDYLQKASVKIISNTECFRKIGLPIFDGHVCTAGSRKVGVCVADSGSPLMVNRKVIGITSFCIPCAKGYPDVFTRVYLYIDFIKSVINIRK